MINDNVADRKECDRYAVSGVWKTVEDKKKVLIRLFISTLYLSAFTFGGGYVIVSLLKKKFVDEYHWIENDEMLDLVAIAQSAPGAIAVNGAIVVGYKLAGLIGAFVAVIGAIIPPFVIITILAMCYQAFRDNWLISQMLEGMQAGVAAVIACVTYEMGNGIAKGGDKMSLLIMAGAFVAACFMNVNVIYIILTCIIFGVVRTLLKGGKKHDLSAVVLKFPSSWHVQFWRWICSASSDSGAGRKSA